MVTAQKLITIGGRAYRPGDPVDTASLPRSKVQQLIAQRAIVDGAIVAPRMCVALRDLRLGGKDYHRKALVDVSQMDSLKVSQLLDHRILDLAPGGVKETV